MNQPARVSTYKITRPVLLVRAKRLRQRETPAETILWAKLRNRGIGYKFRRQYPIANYILDFYCAETKLCVEVDGQYHEGREEYDARRTRELEGQGIRVIRFTNEQVVKELGLVLGAIGEACK